MNNFYQVVGKGTVYQLWTACRFGWTVPSLRKYCRCIFWIIFIRYRYVYQLGAFNCRIGSTESSWSKEINFYEQFLTSTVCLSTWCFGPQVCICCWWWCLLYPGGSDHQPEDLEAVLHIGGCSGRRHSVNKGLTGRGGGGIPGMCGFLGREKSCEVPAVESLVRKFMLKIFNRRTFYAKKTVGGGGLGRYYILNPIL